MNIGLAHFPLVSVLIPLYNAEQYLSECLDSVITQTYKNIEIIIVNDGSTDDSLSIAESYAKRYSFIKVYSQENSGAASARNKAFTLSSGEYIQYFDADDIFHPEKIASQIEALKQYDFHPLTVATGKWTRFYNSIEGVVFQSQITYKSYNQPLLFLQEEWANSHYMIGHSWLISRKMKELAGEWDNNISVVDDGVFFARVAYNADKIVYVPESIVYWRQDNMNSLSKNISRKGMESHFMACKSYLDLVKKDIDFPRLKYALAMEYSKFIFRAYPAYMDLVKEAEKILNYLGYDKPLPLPTRKFRLSVKLIGFYPTARVFGMKDKLMKRLRGRKG
jgi:glycosyltransferase involved in cell wall biosynthesis